MTQSRRRFGEGRLAFVQAADIAAELGHTRLAPAHLLLGLLANARGEAHAVLTEAGLTYAAAHAAAAELPDAVGEDVSDETSEPSDPGEDDYTADRDALAAIGIDLDRVRAAVRDNLGQDIGEDWSGRPREGRRGRGGRRHGHGPHGSHEGRGHGHGRGHGPRGRRGRRGPLAGPELTPALHEMLSGLRAEFRQQRRTEPSPDQPEAGDRRRRRGPDPLRLLTALVELDDAGITAILATAGDPIAVREQITSH